MPIFPEVHLAAADPATLRVYRNLMTAAGSGSPALIFRHMATYPGLLDWIWAAVGADVEAGWPGAAVWRIVADQGAVPLPAFTAEELARAGLDAAARATVGHMLTSYNRMNPVNLIAVGAARALIAGDDLPPPARPFSEAPSMPPAPPPDLPRPLKLAGLDAGLQAAIAGICRTIPKAEIAGAPVDVTPTMYLHFAHWPDFMHRVAGRLDASLTEIDAATHAFADACKPLIGQLLAKARARNPGPPPVDDPRPLLAVMDTFAYVIPHMVVVGAALETALAD
ncbi:hypothetical protein RJ527_11620 [Thalassospiraceae bacterium LMO-SO8]|nr:hypothetical protein [Alphaproteobacteria bacterium LMO-S08]WND74689.1 hypothetical protein RJ527_11620 [Thalassospiraceae bacterium LMO-SO8]